MKYIEIDTCYVNEQFVSKVSLNPDHIAAIINDEVIVLSGGTSVKPVLKSTVQKVIKAIDEL